MAEDLTILLPHVHGYDSALFYMNLGASHFKPYHVLANRTS
jgi:hypothetical protein